MNVLAVMIGTACFEWSIETILLMRLLLTGLLVLWHWEAHCYACIKESQKTNQGQSNRETSKHHDGLGIWHGVMLELRLIMLYIKGGKLRRIRRICRRDSKNQLFKQPVLLCQLFLLLLFHCSIPSYTSSSVLSISSLTLRSCGSSNRSLMNDNNPKMLARSRYIRLIPSDLSADPSRIPTANKTRDRSKPGVTLPKVQQGFIVH